MRILLDECVPRPLRKLLVGHEVSTAQEAGLGGIENGELLRRAEGRFELFITADKNLRYQQNLTGRKIAIIELPTPDWSVIKKMEQQIQTAVSSIRAGNEYIEISLPGNL
ncbi:MAG: DUF5615 family PIN-like protein [Limisphaerales bacterium]